MVIMPTLRACMDTILAVLNYLHAIVLCQAVARSDNNAVELGGLQWQCCDFGSGSTGYRLGRLTRSGPIGICKQPGC